VWERLLKTEVIIEKLYSPLMANKNIKKQIYSKSCGLTKT